MEDNRNDFIIGHDDEPDYNDDHTGNFKQFNSNFDDFPSFNSQGGYSYDQREPADTIQEQYSPVEQEQGDRFLDSFIQNNMNTYSQYEENIQPTEDIRQEVQPKPSQNNNIVKEDSESLNEPSLREFTLLVSKLLFHLSQM